MGFRSAGIFAVTLGGCSFSASTVPAGGTEACIPKAGPIETDTVVAVGAAVIDFFTFGTHKVCGGDDGCLGDQLAAGALTLVALPFLASAIYGFAVGRCAR